MSSAESLCYTLINPTTQDEDLTEQQIKADLEDLKADNKQKAEALKRLIVQTLNGEKFSPTMAIHVIKYLLPNRDHVIKKLLLIYWEIVPKGLLPKATLSGVRSRWLVWFKLANRL